MDEEAPEDRIELLEGGLPHQNEPCVQPREVAFGGLEGHERVASGGRCLVDLVEPGKVPVDPDLADVGREEVDGGCDGHEEHREQDELQMRPHIAQEALHQAAVVCLSLDDVAVEVG